MDANSSTLFTTVIVSRRLTVPMTRVQPDMYPVLKYQLRSTLEGKCIVEGYVCRNSIAVKSFSAGLVAGSDILFDVAFECRVCVPYDGLVLKCKIVETSLAGLRAKLRPDQQNFGKDEDPLIIFVANNHLPVSSQSQSQSLHQSLHQHVQNEDITVEVIGHRYGLNDAAVSVIAKLVE